MCERCCALTPKSCELFRYWPTLTLNSGSFVNLDGLAPEEELQELGALATSPSRS